MLGFTLLVLLLLQRQSEAHAIVMIAHEKIHALTHTEHTDTQAHSYISMSTSHVLCKLNIAKHMYVYGV